MKFDNNELSSFLERDNNDIDNIIESELIYSMPADIRELYFDCMLEASNDVDDMVQKAKMNYARKEITTTAELDQRIDEIISDDPRRVVMMIKAFKALNFVLVNLTGAAFSYMWFLYRYKPMSDFSTPDGGYRWGELIWRQLCNVLVSMGIGFISRSLMSKVGRANYIVRFGAKLARGIFDCRDSDANKIRMLNEVLKTTNRSIRVSKNNIEKEILTKYMNEMIIKRDEIASRHKFMSYGAPPPETRAQPNNNTQPQQTNTQPQQNNATQPQQQNNGNANNTQNQQPTTNTNQPQQNNNTPSQPQQNPENVVKNNEETKQQQKQS